MSQFLRPFIAIALYALLLPVAGPLLDHHYVEWQHNHAHLYFNGGPGGEAGAHLHIYDSRGPHGHPSHGDSDGGADLPEGVAYLGAFDGHASGVMYSPATPNLVSPCYPDPGDCPLLKSFDSAEVTPRGTYPPPPQKPPAA